MKKYSKKLKGFSLAEAIITIVIMGVIGTIVIPQWKAYNPTQRGFTTHAIKMEESLTQATTKMLALNASLDNLTILKRGDNPPFSVADADATPKMAELFIDYLSKIDLKIDISKPYYTSEILDYKRNPVGKKINAYSNFHYANDGMLVGYQFYGSCNATEPNAIPPERTEKYEVTNICGSIFYDVNAYKKPNKLGSDQYIIPVGIRGIQYDNTLQ